MDVSTAKCQLACPEGRPSEDCSLCLCEGHILDGEALGVTGVPVAGARVALASQPKVVLARTDVKGHFRLTGVCSSSSMLISISKEKFAPVTVASTSNTTGISWVHAVLRSAGECWKIKEKRHHSEASERSGTICSRKVLNLSLLVLTEKPYMVKHPEDKVRYEGGRVLLCCKATGSPAPDKYYW